MANVYTTTTTTKGHSWRKKKTLAGALNPGTFSQYKTSDACCTLQTNKAMGRGSLLNIQSPKFLKCILRKTSCM